MKILIESINRLHLFYRLAKSNKSCVFVNFTTQDGLINDEVKTIHSTDDGMIWFGTNDGVSGYDMRSASMFSAADGLDTGGVYTIDQDTRGTLWLGTWDKGAFYFNGRSSPPGRGQGQTLRVMTFVVAG